MRTLAASLFLVLVASSAMANDFNVGGTGRGDCDYRDRGPTYCIYGNPYYNSATATFTNDINPYYSATTGTYSSLPPNGAVLVPRRVRYRGH
jgi:hypothetical protein